MSLLRISFHLCGSDYSRGTQSVTTSPEGNDDDLTTPRIGGMALGLYVLIDSVTVLLLDGRHCLEAMRQVHVEGDVG